MSIQTLFADVILSLNLQQLYTYRVPVHLSDKCVVGKRVVVQFAAKRFYTALIYRLHSNAPSVSKVKEVVEVVDDKPVVGELHLKFWKWMADYYMANLGEVYRAALPSVMKLESETVVSLVKNEDLEISPTNFSETELEILRLLEQGKASIKDIQKQSSFKNPLTLVKKLIAQGVVELHETLTDYGQAKVEKFIVLNPDFARGDKLNDWLDQLARAKKQQQLLQTFIEICSESKSDIAQYIDCKVPKNVLLKKSDTSSTVLKELIKKEILFEEKIEISRLEKKTATNKFPELSEAQQLALEAIHRQFGSKDTVLFQGVTGAGKTEIYMHLIRKVLNEGKQVLYLLPEIALTTQIISRMQAVFGVKVGVYHSKFRSVERAEVWSKVLHNNYSPSETSHQLIVGVRSAVFLPLEHLGLIIIDEEHENSFKQYDPAPRYHARDAAIMLAHMHKAKVLLGTATPSVESFHNAREKKYGFVQLTKRYNDVAMPKVLVVDTLDARKRKKMRSIFSAFLLDKIEEALGRKEQVILFQNRRGYSPYVQCNDCGWIPKCEHCDVSLTYHKFSNTLTCHYCGYGYGSPSSCHQCKSTNLQTKGYGTEKIEDELKIFFPEAIVERLDMDTTRRKNAFPELIKRFENRKIDILVGTQMVTKGLDFDNVFTVGIMNADSMLNFPDFRSNERSFQLMHQVSGRAGRKRKQGEVILQTTMPQHHVVKQVVEGNPHLLIRMELEERERFLYPPFVRMIKVLVKSKDDSNARYAADVLGNVLKEIPNLIVLGPEPGLISRLKGYFVRQIIIKITDKTQLAATKKKILHKLEAMKESGKIRNVFVQLDVDPL